MYCTALQFLFNFYEDLGLSNLRIMIELLMNRVNQLLKLICALGHLVILYGNE